MEQLVRMIARKESIPMALIEGFPLFWIGYLKGYRDGWKEGCYDDRLQALYDICSANEEEQKEIRLGYAYGINQPSH